MGKRKIELTTSEKEFVKPLLLTTKASCLENANPTYKKRAETIDELLAKFDVEGRDMYSEKQYMMLTSCLNEFHPLDKSENGYTSLTAIQLVELQKEDSKKIEAVDLVSSILRKIKKQKIGFTFHGVLANISKLKTADTVYCSNNEKKINKLAFGVKDEIFTMPLGPHAKLSELIWKQMTKEELDLFSQGFMKTLNVDEAKKEILEFPIESNKKDIAFIEYILG